MKKNYPMRWQGMYYLCLNAILFLFVLSSCQKQVDEQNEIVQAEDGIVIDKLKCGPGLRGSLVGSELVATFTADQLKAMSEVYAPYARYGINLYKISYLTKYKGKIIQVSGAVGVPILPDKQKASIVAYAHGTMFTDADDLPSKGTDPNTLYTTAYGFIVFAPDYVGYRDSKQVFHPYFVNEASDAAVCDMMIAGRRFLQQNNIVPKPKLFMYGISQGGTVALSAQRAIENDPNYKHRIRLTAVAPAIGVYEPNSLFMQPSVKDDSYKYPCFFTFMVMAYNNHYNMGKSLDQIFQNSNGQTFLSLLEKNTPIFEIVMGGFPVPMNNLFQDSVRQSIAEGTSEFNIAAQKNNTIYGWVPRTKLRLYYSEADDIVPSANATLAYNTFVAAGSKSVELVATPPLDHLYAGFYSFTEILPWFDSL